jgi:hypothetical protein
MRSKKVKLWKKSGRRLPGAVDEVPKKNATTQGLAFNKHSCGVITFVCSGCFQQRNAKRIFPSVQSDEEKNSKKLFTGYPENSLVAHREFYKLLGSKKICKAGAPNQLCRRSFHYTTISVQAYYGSVDLEIFVSCLANRNAAIMLEGLAMSFPAMS